MDLLFNFKSESSISVMIVSIGIFYLVDRRQMKIVRTSRKASQGLKRWLSG